LHKKPRGRIYLKRNDELQRTPVRRAAAALLAAALVVLPLSARAEDQPRSATTAPAEGADTAASNKPDEKPALTFNILYVRHNHEEPLPLSLLDLPTADKGIAGANLGIDDNNTTGRFLNQKFKLQVIEDSDLDALIKKTSDAVTAGSVYAIADMEPDALLKFADAMADKPVIIANIGTTEDSLREENCRANVLHVAPTRTMLADALGQYLVWKKWTNWLLIRGPRPEDKELADAYNRTAKRFGAKIVEEKEFKYESGSRRADGGYEQVQKQIPQFLQSAPDHDIVIVADETDQFADYVPYRTWLARPVAGSAGLKPSSWHPALELWGGTQFQNRFRRISARLITDRDYDAWVATRVLGEAATRAQSADYKTLEAYIHSPKFEVAGFKGERLTFRAWNGQLREPLLISQPKLVVSVSPQPGFLHQYSILDTLGIDKPETKCKAYAKQ
jgi:ABC transporter substrate binding protein (PQQ-dependent alcohol dehydrogenase system)